MTKISDTSFVPFILFRHVECMRREGWGSSKVVNNIRAMHDRKIRDALAFVYLDIHLTVCQNSKYTNFMQSTFAWNVCC